MKGRILWLRHITAGILFLLFPAPADAAVDAPEEDPDLRHGSAVGEWRPGEGEGAPALSVNEPMYIVIGRDEGDTKTRFQFSFKYRLFDAEGFVVQSAPWLENLHLGYTQTSLWNLSVASRPFEDSSYRPSLFWQFLGSGSGAFPDMLRTGYEHESNGQGGESSRSIDTLFLWPAWEIPLGAQFFTFAPKLYLYLDKDEENSDIEDYRGYADLYLRYGRQGSWLATLLWRYGMENKTAFQLDLSYPIRERFFARAGGYFYFQAFYGYGQSLLTYDRREELNVGIGFAIVR